MNKVIISGNLCKDIELKKSMQNKSYISFTLGVREYTGEKKQSNFIDFKAFGAKADTIAKYLHKGDYIVISGRLEKSSYTKDGKTNYYTDVIVEDFEFAPKPKAQTQTSENPLDAIVEPPAPQGEEVPLDSDLTDDDLPF